MISHRSISISILALNKRVTSITFTTMASREKIITVSWDSDCKFEQYRFI